MCFLPPRLPSSTSFPSASSHPPPSLPLALFHLKLMSIRGRVCGYRGTHAAPCNSVSQSRGCCVCQSVRPKTTTTTTGTFTGITSLLLARGLFGSGLSRPAVRVRPPWDGGRVNLARTGERFDLQKLRLLLFIFSFLCSSAVESCFGLC